MEIQCWFVKSLDKSGIVWYNIIEEYYTIIPYLDLPPFAYMANLCRFWGLRHSALKILKRKSIAKARLRVIKLNKKIPPRLYGEKGQNWHLPRERSKMNFNHFLRTPVRYRKNKSICLDSCGQ